MSTTITHQTKRTVKRIRALWAELDYAQRRLVEIQTGVSCRPGPRRLGDRV
jgi:hypothetical protein